MLKKILYVISSVLLSTVLLSCEDDLRIDEVIPEGEGNVSFEVRYNPLRAVKVNTGASRTPGDAIGAINNLTVYMYDKDQTLVNIFTESDFVDYKVHKSGNTDMPADVVENQAEAATDRATFTIPGISFGHYYFYVVANMTAFDRDDVATVEQLKSKSIKWDTENIAANNQMFGYFTAPDKQSSKGFDAPLCTVNKKTTLLHAWMKRAASKVTVCFDGSGLHENIWIYIRNVTIKDIPATCTIGQENKVPINPIEPNQSVGDKPVDDWDEYFADGESLYYDTKGVIADGLLPSTDFHNWLSVSKGSGILGEHSETAPALYFYENCQGDFPGQEWYSKVSKQEDTGVSSWEWGHKDFKDNVPGGTYIEVEGYYVSTNANQVSNGPIIYRFMLGQDVEHNYNAFRNDHYKLTLGFKGYANQPDWHINYIEKDPEIYTGQTYYLSYAYNQKGIFPIRIVGDVTEFDVEIVENNWAPFDPNNGKLGWDSIPNATVGDENDRMAFKWYRKLYENNGYRDKDNGGFYYGLHKTSFTDDEIKKGAPKYRTPIWAGFLALMVPDQLDAVIFPSDYNTCWYSNTAHLPYLKDYYFGKGGGNGYSNNTDQSVRKFTKEDLTFSEGQYEKTVGSGNNECKITKAADGSITVHLPMWTRQKNLFGISGFSGNNPYDTYHRKATVKLTASYEGNTVTQFKPVYQVRRIVNPKGVWRRYDDTQSFSVKLMRRPTADAEKFETFDSDGQWRAHISVGDNSFISLTGGTRTEGEYIYGETGTPIDFTINFKGVGANETKCAVIQIEYHGFTCTHQIFVRQGYFNPIQVEGNARWSSFSLFSCGQDTENNTQWDAENKNYIEAEVTASPLALGTLFKRGNYAQGILISNNATNGLGPLEAPGQSQFTLSNGKSASWSTIQGLPYNKDTTTIKYTFAWGRFHAKVNGEDRYYRVPTYDEYNELLKGDYGVGVLYADGAGAPAEEVDIAYGFEDFNNDGSNSSEGGNAAGMRGIIVYNTQNANQVFFPVGARGIGRRTVQNAAGSNAGVLRYGAVATVLDGGEANNPTGNQYRPIPYNLPASPGAAYWLNKISDTYMAWDMNYFDLNFNAYDYAVGLGDTGDALPIKLVVDEEATNTSRSRHR